MGARIIDLEQEQDYWGAIRHAASVLDNGGLVVFPTETVYGVAARADRPEALSRLLEAKQRPEDKPFTVHLGRRSDAKRYVPDLSPLAERFIRKGWPGPITLLLSTADPAAAEIAADLDPPTLRGIYHNNTVGLRCPDEPRAANLLTETAGPVVAASANLHGHTPPRTAEEAIKDLDGAVDLVLDGGPARYNKPSTIVRVNGRRYEVIRQGVFDERTVGQLACLTFLFVCTGNTCRSPMAGGLAARLIADRLGCRPGDLGDQGIHLLSAGTAAADGCPVSDHAVSVLGRRSIDISYHRSRALTVELINQADYIFAMTTCHRETIVRMCPSAAERTSLLAGDRDIPDPLGSNEDVYARCAEAIERGLVIQLAELPL